MLDGRVRIVAVNAVKVVDDHHCCCAVFKFTDRGLGLRIKLAQRDSRAEQVNVCRDQQARCTGVPLRRGDPRPGQAIEDQRSKRNPATTSHYTAGIACKGATFVNVRFAGKIRKAQHAMNLRVLSQVVD